MKDNSTITTRLLCLASAWLFFLAGPVQAGLQTELGILDLTANGGINPATGEPWAAGDTYRFIFASSTGTQATSTDINYYNTFVQDLADASALNIGADEGVTWKAIASTGAIAARDNTETNSAVNGPGESIWLLNGTTLVADDYADLYGFQTHSSAINKSETLGTPYDGGDYTSNWTGSDGAGGIQGNDELGAADGTSRTGLWAHTSGAHWIQRFSIDQTRVKGLYGLSMPLTLTIPTYIWDETDNNWDSPHWLLEGEGAPVVPVAGEAMVVNGGTVHVLSDLSGTYPAYSLQIAREAAGGTVNVGNGASGHLTLSSHAEVKVGGMLNVNNGILEAGKRLEIPGGTVSVGADGTVSATTHVNVAAAGALNASGPINTPLLNTLGTTSISAGSITELNADAGTVEISTPTNTITTLNGNGATINIDGAVLATNVTLKSGIVNVAADTAAETLNVKDGQINAASNDLVIGSEMRLGSTTYTGVGFGAGGTITKDGLERLELNGGTVSVVALSGPPEGAIAYYSFDDVANPTNDDTGNGNVGTFQNAAAYTASGKLGGGMSLPDNNSRMLITRAGGGDGVDIGDEWTIAAWFKDLDPTNWRTLVRGSGSDHQVIVQDGNTRLGVYANGHGNFRPAVPQVDLPNDLIASPDGWHHLAAVGTGGRSGQTDFYLDGVWVGQSDEGSDSDIYSFGNYQGGGQRFAEYLDEFFIYPRALDGDGIKAIYDAGAGAAGVLDLSGTDLVANSTSTLDVPTPDPLSLADVSIASGQGLTLSGAPSYSVKNVIPGAGSTVAASTGAAPGDADLLIGGTLSPGDSIGQLDVQGNLTMKGTSTYDWELGEPLSDTVVVTGDLALEAGWTVNLMDFGGNASSSDEFVLFTYSGDLAFEPPVVTGPDGWDLSGVQVMFDANRVYLTGLNIGGIVSQTSLLGGDPPPPAPDPDAPQTSLARSSIEAPALASGNEIEAAVDTAPAVDETVDEPIDYAQGNVMRVTEYYLSDGDFIGTTTSLVLNRELASDYFILVRGSRTGDGRSMPDNDCARVVSVPGGRGDLGDSGAADVIGLQRAAAETDWEGVVTVVECATPDNPAGFRLVDAVVTDLSGSSGTATCAPWSDASRVVPFGGYRGGGVELVATPGSHYQGTSAYVRLSPGTDGTLNWQRDGGGEELLDVTMTTFVVEWGSGWTVQHAAVAGSNGGNGADEPGEYTTAAINPVARANTWVWGTGLGADAGIGDCAESCLVTLGDGVSVNATESTVAVGSEYTDAYSFDVYALTHPGLAVDHRFKPDGDRDALDLPVSVNPAPMGARYSWVYNGCSGTSSRFPRPRFWSRYTAEDTVTLSRGYDGADFPAWIQGIDFSQLSTE